MILDGRVRGFGRGGRVWGMPKKVNLGRKWVETEGEGKSSCEKLRAVLAELLVVALCQNTPSEIQIPEKYRKTDFRTSGIYSDPPFRRPTPVWGPTELPINHPRWLLCAALGRVRLRWGYSKGILGISSCQTSHKNRPRVWERCFKTHIQEH